jgi:hypothetical protein
MSRPAEHPTIDPLLFPFMVHLLSCYTLPFFIHLRTEIVLLSYSGDNDREIA